MFRPSRTYNHANAIDHVKSLANPARDLAEEVGLGIGADEGTQRLAGSLHSSDATSATTSSGSTGFTRW